MVEALHDARSYMYGEYTDSNRYETLCPRGHRGIVVLQQQKFEVLFEIGAYAINDGYYREAVSSFTSSLERFYEFFIRAFFYEYNLDAESFAASWKHVANQSQRQLGAYVMAYTHALRRAPTLLDTAKVGFRNAVIHKGKIPTRAEAVGYGEAVLALLRHAIREASESFPQGVRQTIIEHVGPAQNLIEEGQRVSTLAMSTIVSLSMSDAEHNNRTLEEALMRLRHRHD